MKKTIYNFCMLVFEVTLQLFIIMVAILVFGQLIGINDALKTYSVWVASICAFSGFIMSYTREKKK